MSFWDRLRRKNTLTLDQFMARIEAIYSTVSGITVTPETALQAPTVHAIDNAVTNAISSLSIGVFRKQTDEKGRTSKEYLPSHPVAKLLAKPNPWESSAGYWADAASWQLRYGNHYAQKARGITGPIRLLRPISPANVQIRQDPSTLNLTYEVTFADGRQATLSSAEMHHVRGRARNGYEGDSPIMLVREAIALEIAAEKFGASFFGNNALPFLVFSYVAGSAGHKTDEEKTAFLKSIRDTYANPSGRFRALMLPKGIELGDPISIDNDKAQFLATRQFQRSVIAGSLGIPPHLVGDLSKGTYNNVEQQGLDFTQKVIRPKCNLFEAAMERDLLTDADRAGGIIIRFNLDAELRGDFKSRQEGLKIQRDAGVITPNEWREYEGRNPLPEGQGGDDVWRQGPSGQTGASQQEPAPATAPANDEGQDDEAQSQAD